jgi:type III secretory pathway component EscV
VDDNLERNAWRIEWNDLRLPLSQGLQPGEVLAEDTPERLRLLGVDSTPAGQPTGRPAAIVLTKDAENCRSAGIRTWDRDEFVLLMLETSIRQAAGSLVNRPLVELYLLRLRESEPDLVSSTLERFDASFLTRVVRDLLTDGIPLDRFSQFLESMASLQATCEASEEQIVFPPAAVGTMFGSDKGVPLEDLTAEDYADFIRWELKRFLSHKYAKDGKHLMVYLMEHSFEGRLASSPPLKPDERQRLLEAVRNELEFLPATSQLPVILTTARVRRALARELRLEFPKLSVIAYQELFPDLDIQPIARIDPSAYE